MDLVLQPVLVASGEEGEGRLVFHRDHLVAVLVRLSRQHAAAGGHWFLEAGFGPLDVPVGPAFPDLPAAEAWMKARLADAPRPGSPA